MCRCLEGFVTGMESMWGMCSASISHRFPKDNWTKLPKHSVRYLASLLRHLHRFSIPHPKEDQFISLVVIVVFSLLVWFL